MFSWEQELSLAAPEASGRADWAEDGKDAVQPLAHNE